jgi:flavin-dependent dehydrogenase
MVRRMSQDAPQSVDVVVIGGGPAGSVSAMLLARAGCRVLVVERTNGNQACIGETLPPRASAILASLGLLERFTTQRHLPSAGIVSAWGHAEPLVNDFLFSPYGDGWHIDRAKFNAMLTCEAVRAGARMLTGAQVGTCAEHGDGWRIAIFWRGGLRAVRCRLIIDATGRSSSAQLRFPSRLAFDHLIAVAGRVRPAAGASASAYTLVEAVDEGWFYSALLPSGDYVAVYLSDADLYAAARRRTADFLNQQLENAPYTRERIGQMRPDTVTVSSARTTRRDAAARSNWLAVGDAARSYDPLSGLGLCAALQMASQAALTGRKLLDGHVAAAFEYDHANQSAFADYQNTRAAYYAIERRWPKSAFWSRRLSSDAHTEDTRWQTAL